MLPGPCDLKYKRCNLHTFSSYFFKRVQPVKTVRLSRRKPQTGSFIVTYEFSKDINTFFLIGISSFALSYQPANQSVWWLCSTNGMASECGVSGRHGWNLVPFIQGHLIGSRLWTEAVSFFFFFRSWIIFIFIFKRRMRKESRVPASKGAFVVLKNMYLLRRGLKCLHISLLT